MIRAVSKTITYILYAQRNRNMYHLGEHLGESQQIPLHRKLCGKCIQLKSYLYSDAVQTN